MTAGRRRRGSWSVQELARLRDLFLRHGVRGTAELLHRSEDSVRRKAVELLGKPPTREQWTAGEDRELRRSWGAVDPRLLGQILGRPLPEVLRRATRLRDQFNQGVWTRAEIAMLKDLYGTRTDADLEVSLLRPRHEIAAVARRLCLAKDKRFQKRCSGDCSSHMPRWTCGEVERLRELYSEHDNLEVAQALGRSVASVANKASQLGLKKGPSVLARIGRNNVAARYGPATAHRRPPASRPAGPSASAAAGD
jgi:hypothetical protein